MSAHFCLIRDESKRLLEAQSRASSITSRIRFNQGREDDGAVTLTVRGAQKIYNCADKLFELSDHDPMGIMVFNNLASILGIFTENLGSRPKWEIYHD